MPWQAGIEAADALFRQRLTSSPDRRRSTSEWKRVRETLQTDATLSRFLTAKGAHTHAEFPFILSLDDHACVEGVIDLLVIEKTGGRCLLIDWKTNRIAKGEEENLRQRYRPQIAAYWKSVREITKLEVAAGIFATATGQFVAYNADELEAEWERLQALPREELREFIAPL
jgi:ATP-dependent exoDNAse (exonuclease V) beta subunit